MQKKPISNGSREKDLNQNKLKGKIAMMPEEDKDNLILYSMQDHHHTHVSN